MLIIAHRGNLNGPHPEWENHPDYIADALEAGYDVEVDVWAVDGKLLLGHDGAQYPISLERLDNSRVWCHAKNVEALSVMLAYGERGDIHCFYHQNDDVTLTSEGYIWTYPGKPVFGQSICVLPEIGGLPEGKEYLGICTDSAAKYKREMKWIK